jgi:hypothetical protein
LDQRWRGRGELAAIDRDSIEVALALRCAPLSELVGRCELILHALAFCCLSALGLGLKGCC